MPFRLSHTSAHADHKDQSGLIPPLYNLQMLQMYKHVPSITHYNSGNRNPNFVLYNHVVDSQHICTLPLGQDHW